MDLVAWTPPPIAQTLLRVLLSMIFFVSSIKKIKQPQQFIETISLYNLVPTGWSKSVAFAIMNLELVLAILLLVGLQSTILGQVSVLLLTVFSGAIGINLIRGRTHIGCGCFGSNHSAKIDIRLIGRNLMLIIAAMSVMLWGGGALALDSYPLVLERVLNLEILLPLVLVCAGIGLLFLLVLQLHKLLLLLPLEEQ